MAVPPLPLEDDWEDEEEEPVATPNKPRQPRLL
jgi:hypothetical protein